MGDNVSRAHAVSPVVEAGNVCLPRASNEAGTGSDRALTLACVQQLVDECAAFPNAAYDDGVDALTQALAILSRPRLTLRSLG